MRCADLDLQKGIWTIPRERSKSNVANEVPLSHWRLRLISKVKLRLHRLIAAQRQANGLPVMPEWWLHGLRRTTASGMAQLRVPRHVIERVLNHISGSQSGVAGIYNRYGYLPEKRQALEKWGRYLERLVGAS